MIPTTIEGMWEDFISTIGENFPQEAIESAKKFYYCGAYATHLLFCSTAVMSEEETESITTQFFKDMEAFQTSASYSNFNSSNQKAH